MNDCAQFHVLEAVISAGIIFISLFFVYQQVASPIEVGSTSSLELKTLCKDALFTIYSSSTPNATYGNSMLIMYVMTNDTEGFSEELQKLLPANVFYNVWIYDGFNRSIWYPSSPREPFGDSVLVHQVFGYNNRAYSLEVEAWRV